MRPHGTQKHLEQRRRSAVELLGQGLNLPAVAEKIGCSVSSVHRWQKDHQKKGSEGLKSKPVPGRPAKLTSYQKRSLTKILVEGPMTQGYSTDLWTSRRIAEVVRKRFGVSYHPNHLWWFLTRMGWSHQKPETRAKERDEKKIEQWKRHTWPHIKKVWKT
jgi:transposase